MTLRGEQEVPYVAGDGWKATELRYRGKNGTYPLAMTLIMPDDMAAFERGLSGAQVGKIAASLQKERTRLSNDITGGPDDDCGTYPYSLNLWMPRFDVGTRAQLKDVLAGLGMPDAFDPDLADFSGIHPAGAGDGPIHIGNVIHQANISVDETGTEAAAATAIGTDTTGGCVGPDPAKELKFRLDHPFFFALRDLDTGAILFAGRVLDPSSKS